MFPQLHPLLKHTKVFKTIRGVMLLSTTKIKIKMKHQQVLSQRQNFSNFLFKIIPLFAFMQQYTIVVYA